MRHEIYMQRALQLAEGGSMTVSPNPMVGAVLVHNDRIVAEGFHQQFGGPHAEVNCLAKVSDPEILAASTLYVTLEPCSHTGKTPPCADLIIRKGIHSVVTGCEDPNPMVKGNGIKRLREQGVTVISGVLENACRELNRRFITFHEKQRPYIILKWARSADGFVDAHNREQGQSFVISSPFSRQLVHRWRAGEGAILVGHNTVINDNPQLNVRMVEGRNPRAIVLTRATPERFPGIRAGNGHPAFIAPEINAVIEYCITENITSVLVEGGTRTLEMFLGADVWDEVRIFQSPEMLGSGLKGPDLAEKPETMQQLPGGDVLYYYRNR